MKRQFLLIMIAVLGLVLSGGRAYAQATGSQQERRAQRAADMDRNFYTKAAEGGLYEVALGQLGQEKATDPQLKQLAGMLVEDHNKVNQQLTQIAQKNQVSVATQLNPEKQQKLDRLRGLSGEEFDKAFCQEIVNTHRKHILLFERQARQGSDPETKTFANNTLNSLREHLQQAQSIWQNIQGATGSRRGGYGTGQGSQGYQGGQGGTTTR